MLYVTLNKQNGNKKAFVYCRSFLLFDSWYIVLDGEHTKVSFGHLLTLLSERDYHIVRRGKTRRTEPPR